MSPRKRKKESAAARKRRLAAAAATRLEGRAKKLNRRKDAASKKAASVLRQAAKAAREGNGYRRLSENAKQAERTAKESRERAIEVAKVVRKAKEKRRKEKVREKRGDLLVLWEGDEEEGEHSLAAFNSLDDLRHGKLRRRLREWLNEVPISRMVRLSVTTQSYKSNDPKTVYDFTLDDIIEGEDAEPELIWETIGDLLRLVVSRLREKAAEDSDWVHLLLRVTLEVV